MTPTRPVMRYHGGKWRLAPWIISHFPYHTTYIEPFGGGASVLLRKAPVAHELTEADHIDLAAALQRLRGMVIISGYDCPLYRDLYAGWRVVRRKTHAFGYGSKRPLERTEQLWISPRTAAAMPQQTLLEGCV